jgi:glycosyltransferase
VFDQTYQDIEYIIIDGGSTDGTIEILRKYENRISRWISASDNGIYDAMNKGIELATGDIIGFLNSDDIYNDNKVIEEIVSVFTNYYVDSCYGDLVYVDKLNSHKVKRYWKSQSFKESAFKKGWHPPHPTFFARKVLYDRYGKFNLNYQIGADYELMLRFLARYRASTYYISRVLVRMRAGGKSNGSIWSIAKANVECYRAWKENGLGVSPFIILKKPLSKLVQFIT